ncbi:hypothetical protein BA6E_101196 [Bacteroidales bacterium 6E]|nr:hypothetical protein BA6E_101196 [Bacteroidales bacterium 6E]
MIVKTVHPHPTMFSGLPQATLKTNPCNIIMFGISGNYLSVFIRAICGEPHPRRPTSRSATRIMQLATRNVFSTSPPQRH